MGKKRIYSTAAVTAMRDTELTGQDLRVYLWVSLHDGMSLMKGTGAGCYASNKTLFEEAGCDYSSGCRSLSKLVNRGHLTREQVGKSTRYRVIFSDPESLQGCKPSPTTIRDRPASKNATTYCNEKFETRANQPNSERDYSPLSGELDSDKSKELHSAEVAQLALSSLRAEVPEPQKEMAERPQDQVTKNDAEASAFQGVLQRYLPFNFDALPPGAKVARFEQAFNEIGRDADLLGSEEHSIYVELLEDIAESSADENKAVAHQANRLLEEMDSSR